MKNTRLDGFVSWRRILRDVAFTCTALVAPFAGMAMEATFEGRPLQVHPARVSACPMNQVWAGYQRPVEQTTHASFVSFDMSAPGELVVVPSEDEDRGDPVVLPLSWKPKMRREGRALHIAVDGPRQFSLFFGKDAPIMHVFANPVFDEPHAKDEIVFGPGEHYVGVVTPRSGQTVRIEEGAVVYGAILVAHAKDVTITGRGIVDGSMLDRADHGSAAYKAAVAAGLPEGFYGAEMAVTTFTCAWSTNVTVRGVTFRDPPRWTMIVRAQSRDVTIENVKIVGCWRYNADGINVCTSENVAIRDSFVRSFDDCIIARGAYLDCGVGPTRNVVAERCVLWCDWGKCLEVWAGHKPCLIENVTFRDIACVAMDGIACDVTTWFGSPSTRIRNITMEDIELDFARTRYGAHLQKSPEDTTFRGKPRDSACLVLVDVQRYGRYLGNQHHEPATDLSEFKVEYENLTFRRFKAYGDVPRLVGSVDSTTSPHTIRGFKAEDMPPEMTLKVSEKKGQRELFNGRDLTNWYTYLRGRGVDNDPKGVFSVTNGVIHVSGEEFGCLTTKEEFSDYRLEVEFRWTGKPNLGPKKTHAPDSGILFHSIGPDGGFGNTWMLSHEYNLILGASGDIWTVGRKDRPDIFVEGEAGPDRLEGKYFIHRKGGEPVRLVGNNRLCRYDISPDWTDAYDVRPAENENPVGEWNTAELVCSGDKATFYFNGRIVNRITRLSPSRGKIQLQSEGCPIEFRRVTLTPLDP